MKKITLFFVFLMMSAVTFNAATANYLRGDVNGDNEVDISDVTALISYVLTGDYSSLYLENADCNYDAEFDIIDVTWLIEYVLRGMWPNEVSREWVDLGLPSGTLWATRNVGANSPEEYGDYFAWGETNPKPFYFWTTYKWCNGHHYTLTKYCTSSQFGYQNFVDNNTELDPLDDAAYVNWGPSWRMPTLYQIYELCTKCYWEWTSLNGVDGYMVTGPNNFYIFLPAAGHRFRDEPIFDGYVGCWSRTLDESTPYESYLLHGAPHGGGQSYGSSGRIFGIPVRAVRVSP